MPGARSIVVVSVVSGASSRSTFSPTTVNVCGVFALPLRTATTSPLLTLTVSVSLNNYLFDPATVKVSSGDVVAVRNGNAKTPHTFTVVGEDVDLELAPGTYQLICRFHESLGMKATLKVS